MSAVAMFAASSCNKVEINEPQIETPSVNEAVGSLEFVAYTEAETKTTLNGLATEWEAEDGIDVNGFSYTTYESGAKVIFKLEEGYEGEIPEAPYTAGYPSRLVYDNYNSDPDCAGTLNFVFSNEHTLTAGEICDDVLAIAYSESDMSLHFKNVVSLIKFRVPAVDEDITEIKFSANEPLAGDIAVNYNDGKPTWAIDGDESFNELVLTPSSDNFVAGDDIFYYVPILPGNKTNLTVTVNGYEVLSGKSIEFKRNVIHDLGQIKVPASTGWSLPGTHNNWTVGKNMLYEEGDYYVAKNVEIKTNEFKFTHADFGWKGVGANSALALGEWHKLNGENNIKLSGATGACDVYMTKDGSKFQAVAAGSPAPEAPVVEADYWGLIGSMTSWSSDLVLTEEGEYLVYKGVELKATDEFKFRKNGEWNEQKIASATAKADIEYDLVDAGINNMKVAVDGTYDVYVKKDLTKVYFMTSGKTPAEANQATTYKFYIKTSVSWSSYYLYAWGGYSTGNWPGKKLSAKENAPDGKGECYYVEIPIGTNIVNFIINNNSGKQTKDLTKSAKIKDLSTGDVYYELVQGDLK